MRSSPTCRRLLPSVRLWPAARLAPTGLTIALAPTVLTVVLATTGLLSGLAAQTHTHGDMVGSVATNRVVVWTRSSAPADVTVIHGTSPTLAGAATTAPVRTTAAADFIAKFALANLAAGTRYYYRTKIASPTSPSSFVLGPISTFVTAPTAAPTHTGKSTLCLIGDIDNHNLYGMFDLARAHRPDLCISLGDFPYADGAKTVADFWNEHKITRADSRLQNFFRSVGVVATWDDHEVVNNWDAGTDKTLVANGTQAWKNYFPLLPEPTEIYHSFRWGPALEVFVLDCRLHRSTNAAPDLSAKTMLGNKQKTWLLAALAASTATFKLICSSVPLRYGTTNTDSWDGFQRERDAILDFIRTRKIRNVVIAAADQHWGAVHDLREGIREYQACPLAVGIRTPLPHADPERTGVFAEQNYGIVIVDPAATPQTMTVELHGANGLLTREVIRAEEPARAVVESDVPEGSFVMDGPVHFRNSNTVVDRHSLEPGSYALTFAPVKGVTTLPSPLDLTVAPGADLRVRARWRDVPDATHPVLHNDSFETPLSGFAIVDEGTTSGPSAWFTSNGYLQQSSNIYGGTTNGADPIKPGTMAVTGNPAWTDYTVHVQVRSKDDDAVGVVFRYPDAGNYYRFSMSAQHDYQRLTKKVSGTVTVLAERTGGHIRHKMHDVRITAIGRRLTVYVDGARALQVDDTAHPSGRVGLYTWGNFLAEFDDLIVRGGDLPPVPQSGFPGALFEDLFTDGTITGWALSDQGTISAPSKWTEANGVLTQASNIYGGSTSASTVPKPGTLAVVTKTLPNDLYFEALLSNPDNDGMGVVFRFKDVANHYRFSWDAERKYRRLAKVVNGTWTAVREDTNAPYVPGRTYRIAVQVEGKRIRIYIDGVLFTDIIDGSHGTGSVGLYSWGSLGLTFDDVLCLKPQADPSMDPRKTSGLQLRPVLTAQLQGRTTDIVGRSPASAGDDYFLALSLSRSPGIPLALVDPKDPRTLQLTPDAVFLWSLQNSPILAGFRGTVANDGYLRAKIHWPPLPGTSGSIMYCGGWIVRRGTSVITEVVPSVAIVFP